jgi:ABC-type transporter Mla subunit MlaD
VNPGLDERDDCGHAFSRECSATADTIDALTRSLREFATAETDHSGKLEELTAQLNSLKNSEKSRLSERQIQKTMRMRGIR